MSDFLQVPEHWDKRYNACSDPCDTIYGPCSCGAWHYLDEEWIKENVEKYGLHKKEEEIGHSDI